jgi:hypothetical protein
MLDPSPHTSALYVDGYTADQMRAFAAAAVTAERERCAQIVREADRHGCACSDRDALADVIEGGG